MATVNSIELRVNLRANTNEKSDQFGRLYAELQRNRTLSLRGLAKHISDHGSIYTIDIVYGVLAKLCKNEHGGLESVEAAKNLTPEQAVEGVRVRFLPDGTKLDDMTSKAFKDRCSLVWGNLIEITGYKDAQKKTGPIYKLTPISNPIVEPEPEP